ncbi:NIF3-like protein 1 isoform X3 [Phymastichus coffea]|uniref:NIF3-like protein 1 isoform X3 n=1 Tax=Phymastichus coffea TaxID=108790 RepID=UPI00273AB28F|nr:NIF3-like protein 1 isoform X3 [Phymastichus coffea]XP_058806570.1 NIF3-like protein 1 isoform X3 [Phymastichus coffea]
MLASLSRTLQRQLSPIQALNMSSFLIEGVPLKQVVDALVSFADTSLAASWDNVGLLIEPSEPRNITHVLLTNDLTEDVMQEAVEREIDMIVSYHPPIFAPLKSVTTKTWKERVIAMCLEKRIALYSPHTSFDSIHGGVNDWLASAFNFKKIRPIEPSDDPRNGMGRILVLKEEISVDKAVQLIKNHTGLSHVRLARAKSNSDSISTVGLCAGSGASVLKGLSTDLYVTGEMLHHDVLDAVHQGTSVILTNHSDSERGFLTIFANELTRRLKNIVLVSVSERDEDPLKIV